jgi:hypothetical protein
MCTVYGSHHLFPHDEFLQFPGQSFLHIFEKFHFLIKDDIEEARKRQRRRTLMVRRGAKDEKDKFSQDSENCRIAGAPEG